MRKFILGILALTIGVCFSACSEKEPSENNNLPSNVTSNDETVSGDETTTSIPSKELSVEALLSQPVVAEGELFCNDDGNGNVILMQYSGAETLVVLPETYQGKTINSLGRYVFGNSSTVQAIKFPDFMTEIGSYSCGANAVLKIVVTGNKTEVIGESAFQGCNALHTVTLNDGLTMIEAYAFSQCANLKSIYIPESVTSIDNFAFYGHPDDFTIYGASGSAVEAYANEMNIQFEDK